MRTAEPNVIIMYAEIFLIFVLSLDTRKLDGQNGMIQSTIPYDILFPIYSVLHYSTTIPLKLTFCINYNSSHAISEPFPPEVYLGYGLVSAKGGKY